MSSLSLCLSLLRLLKCALHWHWRSIAERNGITFSRDSLFFILFYLYFISFLDSSSSPRECISLPLNRHCFPPLFSLQTHSDEGLFLPSPSSFLFSLARLGSSSSSSSWFYFNNRLSCYIMPRVSLMSCQTGCCRRFCCCCCCCTFPCHCAFSVLSSISF